MVTHHIYQAYRNRLASTLTLTNVISMEKPVIDDSIRAYQKWLAYIGGKSLSRTARSLAAKRTARARWALRYVRYGESGRRYNPGWLKREYARYKTVQHITEVTAEQS